MGWVGGRELVIVQLSGWVFVVRVNGEVEGEGGGGTSCVDPAVRRVVVRDADRFCAAGAAGAALYEFPAERTSVQWLHLVAASGNRTQASDSTSTRNDCVTNRTASLLKGSSHRD